MQMFDYNYKLQSQVQLQLKRTTLRWERADLPFHQFVGIRRHPYGLSTDTMGDMGPIWAPCGYSGSVEPIQSGTDLAGQVRVSLFPRWTDWRWVWVATGSPHPSTATEIDSSHRVTVLQSGWFSKDPSANTRLSGIRRQETRTIAAGSERFTM